MALSKKIKLSNGITTNYHIVKSAEVIDDTILVVVHSFLNKKFYDLSKKKLDIIREQAELNKTFNELSTKTDITEAEQKALDKVITKINKLAEEADKYQDYTKYVLMENIVTIPFTEDFSLAKIEESLQNTDLLSKSELVD